MKGTVDIAIDRCKGCDLCVAVCPPNVLVMSSTVNVLGFNYPELQPGCTGCERCAEICPDFCFTVYREVTA